ncbi:MAG: ABC transporter substrate-binding protein [Candidatus Nomurabacteria bacterium]
MNFGKILNFKSVLLGMALFAVIIALLGFSGKIPIFNSSSNQKLTGTVNVWGTIPADSMAQFTDLFDKTAKSYAMNYTEVPYDSFNSKLVKAIANGSAPDLVIAPSDILFANISYLYPVTVATIPESKFRNDFIDESALLIDMPYGYLGLPLSVDPLVLYYNRDILSSNGFSNPPKTWGSLYSYDSKITKKDSTGNVSLSTIAFGTYDNIPHATDVLLAMIIQQGQTPVSVTYVQDGNGGSVPKYNVLVDQSLNQSGISPLNSSLAFSKDFSDTQKTSYNWNAKSDNALQQFISGNLAFYVGYASEGAYIKSANQKLYFDYTYIPQIDGSNTSSTYGKLNTVFMLRSSPGASPTSLAYQVMKYLATGTDGVSQDLIARTGGISALKANIANMMSSNNQDAEIFGNSALISKGFYDLHRNDLEVLMRDAIRKVYNGEASTVEASTAFSDNLQAVYDGQN